MFLSPRDPRFTSTSSTSSALAYADPFDNDSAEQPRRVYIEHSHRRHYRHHSVQSGMTAYCVRTCDGRYFPLASRAKAGSSEACHSFCPAAATEVYRGSSIGDASNEDGKSYTSLPNAFRYQKELVAGCSCSGSATSSLAKIDVADDPTLRKGDIIVTDDGMKIVTLRNRRDASLNFSPAPLSVRSLYERSAAAQ